MDGAVLASSLSEVRSVDLIVRLLARTAPSMKSKQFWHKKDEPSPNYEQPKSTAI